MIEIRRITRETAQDLRLPNEPFEMPGKFIPQLSDGVWSYRTEAFPAPETMVFPNEDYDFEEAFELLFKWCQRIIREVQ